MSLHCVIWVYEYPQLLWNNRRLDLFKFKSSARKTSVMMTTWLSNLQPFSPSAYSLATQIGIHQRHQGWLCSCTNWCKQSYIPTSQPSLSTPRSCHIQMDRQKCVHCHWARNQQERFNPSLFHPGAVVMCNVSVMCGECCGIYPELNNQTELWGAKHICMLLLTRGTMYAVFSLPGGV
jgi:hypothetical protein